jgi:L-threonylcarbamoyladenylate synthase
MPDSPARRITQAVAHLLRGELVALPTETVYGLGADAANPAAVAKIFAAKGRPADHPLIVHLAAAEQLQEWAQEIPQSAWELAAALWPGPLTLILKKQPWVPLAVTGGQDTVGLRIPRHPLALELLAAFAEAKKGAPAGIAAPSANRFGRISPTTAAHVREELGADLMILDGGSCPVGIESTIVDLSRATPEILRPGHIGVDALARILGKDVFSGTAPTNATPAPRVSGALASHYAPQTPVRLVASAGLPEFLAAQCRAGQRCGVLAIKQKSGQGRDAPDTVLRREMPADPVAYAHDLYAALRALDEQALTLIVVEAPPETPAWAAVRDRLGRAAA